MRAMIKSTGASLVDTDAADSLLGLVKRAIEDVPTGERKEKFAAFERLVGSNPQYLRELKWYFFINMHHCLTDQRPPGHRRASDSATVRAEQQQTVTYLKDQIVKVVLMNLTLPTGRPLREATFAECADAGGWFKKLATRGKPHEIVGVVLSEDDLQKLK